MTATPTAAPPGAALSRREHTHARAAVGNAMEFAEAVADGQARLDHWTPDEWRALAENLRLAHGALAAVPAERVGAASDALMLLVWREWARAQGNDGAVALFDRCAADVRALAALARRPGGTEGG